MSAAALRSAVRVSITLVAASLLLADCDGSHWRDGDAVPLTAPDTLPDWVWADSNMIPRSDSVPAPTARNVLQVGFDPTASSTQRRAAIQSVGGRLIGGEGDIGNGTGGIYYISVDAPTVDRLERLCERLKVQPKVDFAGLAFVVEPRIETNSP